MRNGHSFRVRFIIYKFTVWGCDERLLGFVSTGMQPPPGVWRTRCATRCYRHVTPNGVIRARRHGSRYRDGSPTGMMACSFVGTVSSDNVFLTGMMACTFCHPHEPLTGFNICSPVRFPTMFRRTPSGVPSPFPHHARHPRHEERQQEEDDGV